MATATVKVVQSVPIGLAALAEGWFAGQTGCDGLADDIRDAATQRAREALHQFNHPSASTSRFLAGCDAVGRTIHPALSRAAQTQIV